MIDWKVVLSDLEHGKDSNAIKVTESEVKDFKERSVVWQWMQHTLTEQLVTLRDTLEVMGSDYSPNDIVHTQAEIFAIRSLLDLPDTLLNYLEGGKK